MPIEISRHEFYEGWLQGVARHINDPVQRLRFVRVAAPSKPATPPRPSRVRAMMFPSVVVVLLSLLLVSATAYLSYHESHTKAPRPPLAHAHGSVSAQTRP
jgi:hypothetical protein